MGDTVEKVIKATGLDAFKDGKDCGCEERKQKLNALFAYRLKPRCLTEDEYKEWNEKELTKAKKLEVDQIDYLCELYADVFQRPLWKPECYNCRGTALSLKSMINQIDRVVKEYDK